MITKSNKLNIEKYIEYIVAQKNLSANTCLSYLNDLNQFSDFFPKTLLTDLKEHDIQNYINSLLKEYAPKTHSRKLSTIKQFYLFLIDENMCAENPSVNFVFPKNIKKLPIILSETEMDKIFEVCYKDKSNFGLRLTTMIEILYATGIRVSELVNIKLSSFDEKFSSVLIRGKGNKERVVPITEIAKKVIKKYLTVRQSFLNINVDDNGFLFPSSSKNNHITRHRFFQMLKDLSVRTNISSSKLSPHVIRHSFATHLLERGVDLRVIQTSLGHSDISTTQIYTHVQTKKLKEILETKHPLKNKFEKLIKF
jgi:integrase/recombinase XerD|tara:strand:+ start:96 stop:1025 length:930 start_codon:yes stop_codon:yes gene_type:complete